VYLTQSIHSYLGAVGGGGEHKIKSLLGNFGTTIVHALKCVDTAKYCSDLLGMRLTDFFNYNPKETTAGDILMGAQATDWGMSQQFQPVLQPAEFLGGMRTSGGVVDGIVIRTERFSTHEQFLRVAFQQARR
jgi:hypothetical protein